MHEANPRFKSFFILLVLFLIAWELPNHSIDPWKLFNLKKIASLIFSLSMIQSLSIFAISKFGSKTGSLVTGFLGGLISSTATTATLAKQSNQNLKTELNEEYLTFFATTLAMLLEGVLIVVLGLENLYTKLFIVFLGPIFFTLISILFFIRKPLQSKIQPIYNSELKIAPILKLSIVIIAVLVISNALQNIFGQGSLMLFTFLTSLFEIHGALIANVQLYNGGAFKLNA